MDVSRELSDRDAATAKRVPAEMKGASTGALISGIMSDTEALFAEHLSLAKVEIKETIDKGLDAGKLLGAALAVAALFGFFLLLTIALALDAYTPIPTWGCFGIVTLLLLIASGVLLYGSRALFNKAEKEPLSQTKIALKEDMTWLSKTIAHSH